MKLKLGKFEAEFPAWLAFVGAIVVDNVYSNRCKLKALTSLSKNEAEETSNEEKEES